MTEKEMTLGVDWDGRNVTGWYVSEKFDGCRCYWDGVQLWTRGGKVVNAPPSFLACLPAGVHLDGEIYCGTGRRSDASKTVRLGGKHWSPDAVFMVFDAPQAVGSWPWRMAEVYRLVQRSGIARQVPILDTVTDRAHLRKMFNEVQGRGGEGLMLRNPDTETYQKGRTADLLKVKYWPQ